MPVFENLSISVAKGEKVVLRGPSGCGKSTVLKMLLGLAQPVSGQVLVEGSPMTHPLAWELRRRVAYANQKIDVPSGKTGDFLHHLFDFKKASTTPKPDSVKIRDAMSQFDLSPELFGKDLDLLSGGELQRIVLVSIILPNRSIYLLDEPTAALDGKRKEQVAQYFLNKNSENTVIVASHDEVWNRPDCASIIEMDSHILKTEN